MKHAMKHTKRAAIALAVTALSFQAYQSQAKQLPVASANELTKTIVELQPREDGKDYRVRGVLACVESKNRTGVNQVCVAQIGSNSKIIASPELLISELQSATFKPKIGDRWVIHARFEVNSKLDSSAKSQGPAPILISDIL